MKEVNDSSISRRVFDACTYPFRAAWKVAKYIGLSVCTAVDPIRIFLVGKAEPKETTPKTGLGQRGVHPVQEPGQSNLLKSVRGPGYQNPGAIQRRGKLPEQQNEHHQPKPQPDKPFYHGARFHSGSPDRARPELNYTPARQAKPCARRGGIQNVRTAPSSKRINSQIEPQSQSKPQNQKVDLDEVYQQLQVLNGIEHPQYDQPLTKELFTHGETNVTYEGELARVNLEADGLAEFLPPVELERQKRNNKTLQRYRFGLISRDNAWQELTKGVTQDQLADLERLLNATTPLRPTKLAREEEQELRMYREVVETLHSTQSHGSSNCQSFANSMEYFMRGMGFQQVVGVMQQLDMNTRPGDPTPVACWNLPKYQADNFCGFLEGLYDFRQAAASGMEQKPSMMSDSPDGLHGSRYILLKTGKQGGAGHVLYMVRSKVTGRFIIIDGQSRQVYPLMHPDGTYTDEAKDILGGRNIYSLRVDNVSDEDFRVDLKRSNDLMKNANKAAEVSMVVERFLAQMPNEGWESVQAGVDWLHKMHVQQYNLERQEYEDRLHNLRRQQQDESALVEPVLCQKSKMNDEIRRVCSDEQWRAMRNNYTELLHKDLASSKEAITKTPVVRQKEIKQLIDHFPKIPSELHATNGIPGAADFLAQFTSLGPDEIAEDLLHMYGNKRGWSEFWANVKSNAYDRFIKSLQGVVRH